MGKVQRINTSIDYRSIESFLKETSIDIYRKGIDKDESSPGQYKQRVVAEQLLRKLGEPRSWKFYLKCAYRLSEARIWELVELALRPGVRDHNRYFVALANKELDH